MPGIRTAVGERGTNDVTAGRVDGELATMGAVIQRRNAWQQQGLCLGKSPVNQARLQLGEQVA